MQLESIEIIVSVDTYCVVLQGPGMDTNIGCIGYPKAAMQQRWPKSISEHGPSNMVQSMISIQQDQFVATLILCQVLKEYIDTKSNPYHKSKILINSHESTKGRAPLIQHISKCHLYTF